MKRLTFHIIIFLLLITVLQTYSIGKKKNQNNKKEIKLSVLSTYATGIFNESAAEIVQYDPDSKRVFFVNANDGAVEILDISKPKNPVKIKSISFKNIGGKSANSIAIKKGIIAVAVEVKPKQSPGMVVFIDKDGNIIKKLTVGALPDMVTISPDGKYILVANEGEPNNDYTNDPEGTVSIINSSKGIENLTDADVKTVKFTKSDLKGDVRITGPKGTIVEQDVEPEYIAVSDDSKYAYVALQENNAIAKIDIANAKVISVQGLGKKDHSKKGNGMDAIKDKEINIENVPFYGIYMPDAIAVYTVKGKTYILSANEGDGREYGDEDNPVYADETKIKKIKLDKKFKDAKKIQKKYGGVVISAVDGDTDGDGDYDMICTFGARSFTIWDQNLKLVWDSGDQFEQIMAKQYPKYFNTSNDKDKIDNRSEKKGPEPEGVTTGMINGEYYAFVLLERMGGIMVYNISNPRKPEFIQYINNRNFGALKEDKPEKAGDLGPEGVVFVPAEQSPENIPLLIVGNEISGTVTIYEIK